MLRLLSAVVLTLGTACGADGMTAQAAPAGAASGKSDKGAKAAPPKPKLVEVATAEPGEGTRTLRFLGHARAALDADLAPAVEGHLLAVKAREGDRVSRGQLLLSLDGRRARASLAAARAVVAGTEASLAQAEKQYGRVKDVTGPAISEPEREGFALQVAQLNARLQAERAEVQRLEVESSLYSLRAPFDGVVSKRLVDPGDWVTVGTPALSLVSLQPPEVHVDVPAEVGAQLSVGDAAQLVGKEAVSAKVAGIVPALDDTTRTMRVRLLPDGEHGWLLSGLALDVAFELRLAGEGVLVPRDAVLRGAVDTRVLRVRDGVAEPITVDVLAGVGARVLVRGESLAAGDTLIVRGNERLSPGTPVTAKPATGTGGG